jgi:hypothetical protein
MPSIEGKSTGVYNATFTQTIAVVSTAWQLIEFKDHLGDAFDSMHIYLEALAAQPLDISFDAALLNKVVAVTLSASKTLYMRNKHATELWVKRHGGVDSSIRVTAWRS